MSTARVGDLEIGQDLNWQRRSWFVNRVGWIVIFLFLVVAAMGVFGGDGPFREAHAGEQGSLEYDRFTRLGSPTELNVRPTAASLDQGKVVVGISSDYLADFNVDTITPDPDSVRTQAGEVIYTFLAGQPIGQIAFSLEPRESGIQKAAVRVGTTEPVEFTQVVYP